LLLNIFADICFRFAIEEAGFFHIRNKVKRFTDSRLDDETTEAFDNAGMEVARA